MVHQMRRMLIAATLAAGCFGEPGPDDHIIASATAPMTTAEPEESSSSDGESSGEESSSTTGDPFNPFPCPDWCPANGCDEILGHNLCRCMDDIQCGDETTCEGFDPEPYTIGHCK